MASVLSRVKAASSPPGDFDGVFPQFRMNADLVVVICQVVSISAILCSGWFVKV